MTSPREARVVETMDSDRNITNTTTQPCGLARNEAIRTLSERSFAGDFTDKGRNPYGGRRTAGPVRPGSGRE